ncbi:hypothetical protein BLNAU_10648 [Blattamonas nauphoetae]|uniref:Uncharacterized protein n=1 Tax=Blattamonas nauphoetae TaxID=2049346 RepID=A0ABQ9XQG7_9EUKA|nr:hypothetical protein BLNAU_10648 [Blattamonas nauphoetae]
MPTGNYLSLIPSDRHRSQHFTDSAAHTRKQSSTTRSSTKLVLPRALPNYNQELTSIWSLQLRRRRGCGTEWACACCGGIIQPVVLYSTNILTDTKIWHSFYSDLIVVDPDLTTRSWYLDEAEIISDRINTAALKMADATHTLCVNCIEKLKPGFDSPVYRFNFTSVDSFMQISDICLDDLSALEMLTHIINSGFHLAEYGIVIETVTNSERFITLAILLIELEVVKEAAVAFSEQMKSGSNVSIFVTIMCGVLLSIYTLFPTTFVLCFHVRENLKYRRTA